MCLNRETEVPIINQKAYIKKLIKVECTKTKQEEKSLFSSSIHASGIALLQFT